MTFQTQCAASMRPVFIEHPGGVAPGGTTFGSGSNMMVDTMEPFLAAATAEAEASIASSMTSGEFGGFPNMTGGFPGGQAPVTGGAQPGQDPLVGADNFGFLNGLSAPGQNTKEIQITGEGNSPVNLKENLSDGTVYDEQGNAVGKDDPQHKKITFYAGTQETKDVGAMEFGSGNLFSISNQISREANGNTTYKYGDGENIDLHAGNLTQSNDALPSLENQFPAENLSSPAQNIGYPEGAQGKETTNVAAYNTFGGEPVMMKKDVQGNLYDNNGQLIGKADEHDHLTLYPSAQKEINQLTRNPLLHNDPGNLTSGIHELGTWASKTPDGGVAFGNNIRIKDV